MDEEREKNPNRHSECSLMTLSFCRRFQILVITFILFLYFIFVINSFFHIFIGNQIADSSSSFEQQNSKDTINIDVKQNNDDTNKEDYENIKDKTGLSVTQGSSYCKGKICISKCCPIYEGFESKKNISCTIDSFNNSTYNIQLFVDKVILIINKTKTDSDLRFNFVFVSKCEENMSEDFELSDVSLVNGGNIVLGNNLYRLFCLDFVVGSKTILAQGCFEKSDGYIDSRNEWIDYEYEAVSAETGLIIFCTLSGFVLASNFSIVAIIIVYSCVPQLRNIHGKIIMCYLFSVLIFNVLFVVNFAVTVVFNIKYILLEMVCNMALISWMSWLTVMCYDIWATFSQPLRNNPQFRHNNRKFLFYSIFCLSNVILHTTLHTIGTSESSEEYNTSVFIRVAVTLNVIMYLSTLLNLRFHKGNIPENSRHGDSLREGIQVYTKLSLLMGIDWLVALVCMRFGGVIVLFIGILIIESQGITLLFLLICNRRVCNYFKRNNRPRQEILS